MFQTQALEKRRSNRIFVKIPAVCEIFDAQGASVSQKTAVVGNINDVGIFLEMDETFPLNTQMRITFALPHNDTNISTMVTVRRVETLENEKLFGIGVSYNGLEEPDKIAVLHFVETYNIRNLFKSAIQRGASDIHLLADNPVVLRVNGELEPLNDNVLTASDVPQLLFSIMSKEQIRVFGKDKELDFGIQYDPSNRFRINIHQQRGNIEATMRLINTHTFSFEELRIPEVVKDMARRKDGLILIVGPTGSGKSTTIAAMIDLINHERKTVIITLERPIEYVYAPGKSIIKQREVGVDTHTFSGALKSSLRQDPNIIVIGELDNTETLKTALTAAEAGYLVVASFHAPGTVQAIDRLASMFPLEFRSQILSQLSNCLVGIVMQLLLPRKDKQGRILATEVVVNNEAVKRTIRRDELIQIPNIIQTGSGFNMHSLESSIMAYYEHQLIDGETANFYCQEQKNQGAKKP